MESYSNADTFKEKLKIVQKVKTIHVTTEELSRMLIAEGLKDGGSKLEKLTRLREYLMERSVEM